MKANRWIEVSRKLYTRLLRLYPHDHRTEFGTLMLQVFSDQCRITYARKGIWGLLILWPRTLLDLGISSLREHFTVPDAAAGLLEAPPNRPLPWKGVFLVIIPGMIFLICQIGQLTGQDWFFWATRRFPFLFIIPVILVWGVTRKFPIWGLIPVGVLYSAFLGFGFRLQVGLADQSHWLKLARVYRRYTDQIKVAVVVSMLIGIIVLYWLIARRQQISRRAWIWLGVYVLLGTPIIARQIAFYFSSVNWFWEEGYPLNFVEPKLPFLELLGGLYIDFYFMGAFLLLILLSGLLARRHGRLAILLPLGYLLPIVVYGGYYDLPPDWPVFILVISTAILIYRVLATIVAPVWILRSASGDAQKRAALIGLWSLVGIQTALNGFRLMFVYGWQWSNFFYENLLLDHLYLAVGITLAINLYPPKPTRECQPEAAMACPQLIDG